MVEPGDGEQPPTKLSFPADAMWYVKPAGSGAIIQAVLSSPTFGPTGMKAALSAAVSLIVLLAPSFGREPILSFLHHIPELRDLSLKMSEDQFKAHIKTHQLYAKRELVRGHVSYYVITPDGENVFVGFATGKCTGIQRMQPIPKQLIKEVIGASEYRAWMAKRKAEPRRPAEPSSAGASEGR